MTENFWDSFVPSPPEAPTTVPILPFERCSLAQKKQMVLDAIRYVERKYNLPEPRFSPDQEQKK